MISKCLWTTLFHLGLLVCVSLAVSSQAENCRFEVHKKSALYGWNFKHLTVDHPSECEQSCLKEEEFECNSFDFVENTGSCFLSFETKESKPSSFGRHSGSDYYEKICDDFTYGSGEEYYGDVCDDFWILFHGHCYNVSHMAETWYEAKDICQESHNDAHLVTIDNEEEYSFLLPLLSDKAAYWTAGTKRDVTPVIDPNCNAECIHTVLGTEYCGKISQTVTGKTCQRWASQYPHEHTRNDAGNFPDATIYSAENYCRNPDKEPNGPWCYTTDPNTRWEYCPVTRCAGVLDYQVTCREDCKVTTMGYEYCGALSSTRSGKTCQRWNSQYPHEHTRNNPEAFPELSIEDAKNYCRNPDNEPGGPWCYTTDPETRWEYCDVEVCDIEGQASSKWVWSTPQKEYDVQYVPRWLNTYEDSYDYQYEDYSSYDTISIAFLDGTNGFQPIETNEGLGWICEYELT